MELKKYEYIDSLRGLAILLVIMSHIALMSPSSGIIPRGLYYFMERGIHGVQLFLFVSITAFIISYFTYKYIEIPGQNLGRRLIKKLG